MKKEEGLEALAITSGGLTVGRAGGEGVGDWQAGWCSGEERGRSGATGECQWGKSPSQCGHLR